MDSRADKRRDRWLARLKRRAARGSRLASASGPGAGFDALAAELRRLTAGRRHTPAEALLRESRDER
jgi:antitoxin FitA